MTFDIIKFGLQQPAAHFSLPGYETTSEGYDLARPSWLEYPAIRSYFKPSHWVIITRRPDVVALSQIRRGMAADAAEAAINYERAMRTFAAVPDAYWISYEALVANPRQQIANLAKWLGVPAYDPGESIVDGNAKYVL